MTFDIATLLLSAGVSLICSIIVTLVYDRRYVFFNKGREKHEVLKSAPKILSERCIALFENDSSAKIFTAEYIYREQKNGGDVEYSCHFRKIATVEDANVKFDRGFRLRNQTDEGISLNTFYSKGGDIINVSNWGTRHIDPGCSVVVLYNVRDCPSKIVASFKHCSISYKFTASYGYIEPTCEK